MSKTTMICPCCGRPFVLKVAAEPVGSDIVEVDNLDAVVQAALQLGIECGILEGGEKIG